MCASCSDPGKTFAVNFIVTFAALVALVPHPPEKLHWVSLLFIWDPKSGWIAILCGLRGKIGAKSVVDLKLNI